MTTGFLRCAQPYTKPRSHLCQAPPKYVVRKRGVYLHVCGTHMNALMRKGWRYIGLVTDE